MSVNVFRRVGGEVPATDKLARPSVSVSRPPPNFDRALTEGVADNEQVRVKTAGLRGTLQGAAASHEGARHPQLKSERMQCIFGMKNDAFQMATLTMQETVQADVRGRSAIFWVEAGPMVLDGHTYERTFVLTIDYSDSEAEHVRSLPLGGFNSGLCFDYAEQANATALAFCERHGLTLDTHLNSWPAFKAIVSVP